MQRKTRDEERSRLMPVLIACVLLIGVAAWTSTLLPGETGIKEAPTERAAQQMLREWNGQIAVFEGNSDKPAEVYEVTVAALPKEEQERLREGIVVESEEALALLLDNYTS